MLDILDIKKKKKKKGAQAFKAPEISSPGRLPEVPTSYASLGSHTTASQSSSNARKAIFQ